MYFENTGTAFSPAFAAASDNPFGLVDVGSWAKPSFADLDGDGDLDAFIGERDGNTKYFENTGTTINPAFVGVIGNPFVVANFGSRSTPSFADLDGGGDLDAFIGHTGGDLEYL